MKGEGVEGGYKDLWRTFEAALKIRQLLNGGQIV